MSALKFSEFQVQISDIRIDGGTQSRASINPQIVSDYAEAIKAGDVFPPVVVFFDGADYWLADGFHRYEAHASAGSDALRVDLRQGTRRDAVLFSVGANALHGLRRTNDDKRRAVLTLLNDAEWQKWPQTKIAHACGVSQQFVSKVATVEAPVSYNSGKMRTVERNGATYEQNTAKIGKREPKPDVAPQVELRIVEAPAVEEPEVSPQPIDAERRKLAKLTPDALMDEVLGLRADLKEAKAELAKVKTERDGLKAQVKDLSATDSGTVIRKLQAEADNAKNAKWREGEKALAFQKQIYALKKELKTLGATEIPL